MTAAIDRFLYRTLADTVTDRISDAYCELQNAFDDLDAVFWADEPADPDTLREHMEVLTTRKAKLYEALDSAETHVADFVEANRP